jgi:predicted ATPase
MRFEVLGPLRVLRGGEPIPLTSGRQRALLANLLIADGDTVAADRLIEDVWGDDLPTNPANTLQHGIAQLRKLLEPDRTRNDPPQVLRSEAAGYRLDLGGQETDVAEFQELVEAGRRLLDQGDGAASVAAIRTALALWRGGAYADFAYADFAQAEAERLEELRIQSRELLVDALMSAEGPSTVIADLEGLVVEYPYREGLWARLMTSLYQSGRQAEALRVYRQASSALGEELGIEPSVELRRLEEQILLQDPSLAGEPRRAAAHNLPAPSTSLIGRDDMLAQVVGFVGSARLTTLTGPGGSGKTRLAIEVAHAVVEDFPGGVWLVRLDDLSDADLLAATIGAAVGMPENRETTVIETLATFLSERRALIVLDNCEHLIEAVAAIADTLLARCPMVTVLATSQIALSLTGEQRVPLPPLRLPGEVGSPFADLETVPAVELFLERAAATDPTLDRSPETIAAAANIVTALDGIPLAIELAAARTDLLTPVEIAHRLADRFEVLDVGHREAPERQRTLRSAVEWSYGLLEPAEQAFFVRLAVFAGGFDAAAAAAVAETSQSKALAMLGRLLQRSLLTREAATAGNSRYRLLETLRLFGIDQLAAADLTRAREFHLDHYATVVRDLDERLVGTQQRAAFAEMLAEQDNLRAAMGWSLESGRLEPGVVIAAWSSRYWDWRGSLAEASTWMSRFIDAKPDESVPHVSLLISWAGYFAWELGEEERSVALVAEAERIATAQHDEYGRAASLTGAALHARSRGDQEAAVRSDEHVRDIGLAIGEPWLIAWADNHDGLSLLSAGDVVGAREAAQASLDEFTALGDRRATGWALTVLAQIAHEQGDHPATIKLADEAVVVSREAGDGRNAAWALELAAEAARASGDEAAAVSFEADAAELLAERGMPASPWRRPR